MPAKITRYQFLINAISNHKSDECLIWPYGKNQYGCGGVVFGKVKLPVHRVAFYLTYGHWPMPEGLHSCRNPSCFNPRHVVEGYQTRKSSKLVPWLKSALKAHGASDKCLEWPYSKNPKGYGQIGFKSLRGKSTAPLLVHRLAFYITYGRWPEPLGLHRCDNPACFNPLHIFEGSYADNNADAKAKGHSTGGSSKGATNPKAKLTEDVVRQIRSEYIVGVNGYWRLATKFGVYRSTIAKIVTREIWTHI